MSSILVDSTALDLIQDVLNGKEKKGTFWISSSSTESTIYADVTVSLNLESQLVMEPDPRKSTISVTYDTSQPLKLVIESWIEGNIKDPLSLIFPSARLALENESEVTSLTISPHGGMYAAGTFDGQILVGDTSDASGQILRRLEPRHLLPVRETDFFPASDNQVLLTAADDMHIQLRSIVDGSNPRTFLVQKAGLGVQVFTGFVGATGRNFVSAAGNVVELWECGSGAKVHTFKVPDDFQGPITSLNIVDFQSTDEVDTAGTSELEFGTEGQAIVVTSGETPYLTVWNIRSKKLIHHTELPSLSRITSSVHFDEGLLLLGTSIGSLSLLQLRLTDSDLTLSSVIPSVRIAQTQILSLARVANNQVIVGTSHAPVLVGLKAEGQVDLMATFVGFDAARANVVAGHSSTVYVAGKEGLLNKYKIQ